ncbi:MAG: endonuclease/exonuclease/phosphatase family protein [Pseudomonadota bacterium]
MKIVSYNIHKGYGPRNSTFVLDNMREALKYIDADIVFLQEVQGRHRRTRLPLKKKPKTHEPQTEYLAEKTWPYFIYGKNAIYGNAHHGNAMLSKYPFVKWENVDVSLTKRASRSLLHGVIEHQAMHLHVICVHLGLFHRERDLQISALSQRIQAIIKDHEPLIIAGDFNDWRKRQMLELENDLGLNEVFKTLQGEHAKSYPSRRPAFAIDRIYYRNLELRHGEVFSEHPWKKLSDHLPLFAEFRMMNSK